MKPNFHAIGALAYGLTYGFKGIPTALRRGWLSLLILLASTYGVGSAVFSVEAVEGASFGLGGIFSDFSDDLDDLLEDIFEDGDIVIESGMSSEEAAAVQQILLSMGGYILAFILFIPALVDLYNESAGRRPREGFLPGFGSEELALIAAVILQVLAMIAFFVVAAIPFGGLVAVGITQEMWPITVLAGFGLAVAYIWFAVRISLVPIHSALRGQIAFGDGFKLTGGRFWKLLLISILMSVVFGLITFAVNLVGVALDAAVLYGASLVPGALLAIYGSIASAGFHGRITGELMGITPNGDDHPGFDDDGGDDEVFDTDDIPTDGEGDWDSRPDPAERPVSGDFAGTQPAAMRRHVEGAAVPQQSYGEDMKRSSVQFVRRRFR